MNRIHKYTATITWEGNMGKGTSDYRSYSRNHSILTENKPKIPCSADPIFRGDKTRYNPEELLVASLSACHMLSYLHLCADNGIVVTEYTDSAEGIMTEEPGGKSRFTEVTLYPVVTVADKSMVDKAMQLHEEAHHVCFIANSCNFPVKNSPKIIVSGN